MGCVEFGTWLFSGIGVVAVLEWMKKLPVVGPVIESNATVLAAVLAALAPFIATTVIPYCAYIDKNLWMAFFFLGTFIIGQVTYRLARATGVIK